MTSVSSSPCQRATLFAGEPPRYTYLRWWAPHTWFLLRSLVRRESGPRGLRRADALRLAASYYVLNFRIERGKQLERVRRRLGSWRERSSIPRPTRRCSTRSRRACSPTTRHLCRCAGSPSARTPAGTGVQDPGPGRPQHRHAPRRAVPRRRVSPVPPLPAQLHAPEHRERSPARPPLTRHPKVV